MTLPPTPPRPTPSRPVAPVRTVPRPASTPPRIPVIEVDVPDPRTGALTTVSVPGRTPEEAFRYLYNIGDGAMAQGSRDLYQGTVIEPIRNQYKATLEQVEQQIAARRTALGANATEAELRALAQWGSRQRTMTARVWRIPQGPAAGLSLEARDWQKYGRGGRTFENLMRRTEAKGLTGPAAYEYLLKSATTSNADVTAKLARNARFLRGGGAVLGVAGLALTAYDIAQAPPEMRARVAERHAVGFAGGLVASEGAVLLLGVGAACLAATPPGWVVIAVGLVAGAIGSYVADHYFFPPEHEGVAGYLGAGVAIDPTRRYPVDHTALAGLHGRALASPAGTSSAVSVIVAPGETNASLTRRALQQAAEGAGLDRASQAAFVRQYAPANDAAAALTWQSGDPTPADGPSTRPRDLAALRGRPVLYSLTAEQVSDLEQRAYAAGH